MIQPSTPLLRSLLLALGLLAATPLAAQELQCQVRLNTQRVGVQDAAAFSALQNGLQRFLNEGIWTRERFSEVERLRCDVSLTLKSESNPAQQAYAADLQVAYARPVYGTDYESPVFNFLDNKVAFGYANGDPIRYTENAYQSELSALGSFYAYLLLGLDFDTFSPRGGTTYYQRALDIATMAQQRGGSGWEVMDDPRSRALLAQQLLSPQADPLRMALYEYHRQGMDVFEKSPEQARTAILGALEKLRQVRQQIPISGLLNAFFFAKSDELVQIFSQGDPQLSAQAQAILIEVDPANANKYRGMTRL